MATSKRTSKRSSFHKRFSFKSRSSQVVAVFVVLGIGAIGVFSLRSSSAAAVHICEVYGSHCVGAPSLGLGDPVKDTSSGRDIYENYISSGNYYRLEFADDTSKCVGGGSNNKVVVKNCTGNYSSETGWDKEVINGKIRWVTHAVSVSLYLTGHNNDTQMFLSGACSNSCYQVFSN